MEFSGVTYIQLLKAHIGMCSSIEREDREAVPVRSNRARRLWVALRGDLGLTADALFEGDDVAAQPLRFVRGGEISVYVRVRESLEGSIEVAKYKISVQVPDNVNRMTSFRFESDNSGRKSAGWEEDLHDNPEHPLNHLHINYLNGAEANRCRFPTGEVCPIVLIRSVDFWYRNIFA